MATKRLFNSAISNSLHSMLWNKFTNSYRKNLNFKVRRNLYNFVLSFNSDLEFKYRYCAMIPRSLHYVNFYDEESKIRLKPNLRPQILIML